MRLSLHNSRYSDFGPIFRLPKGRLVWGQNEGPAVSGSRIGDDSSPYVSMESAEKYLGTRVFRKPKERKPKPFVARTAHLYHGHPARARA